MSATTIIKEDFKHSFSSVSKFRKNPSEWLCHYALGLKSPSSPAMTRGSLAEFGTYYKIKKGMQQKDDKGFAKLIEHRFKKLKYLNAEKEIVNAIEIAKKFEEILYERQLRDIVSYQKQLVQKIDGLKYPVRLFTDFEYDNIIVDTKSTLRLPTAPKVDHIRQQALYSTLHKKKIALLYATPKKSLWYELSDDDVKVGYEETINDFKSLENYIIMCKNNLEEAIKITPLNTDPNPFEWDYNIKQEAKKIWQKVRK
jgi:hypothetical protein